MKILLLNQCFYPDHVATAQHLTDLAHELVKCGHHVTVVASSRGYDNPDIRYPVRETWRGIHIRRIWTPGLGKRAKWRRFTDFAFFWGNATRILLLMPRQDATVCLTTPPLISTLGTVMARLKGGAVVPWVMDLNPDEAVAAGWLKAGGFVERVLTFIQNWSFRHSSRIIALDRFMADRLQAKGVQPEVIHTDAPWSHDQAIQYDTAARAAFRAEHGLADKFVVMYSGNHSPCHPLDAVLEAALEMKGDDRLHFLFVGGGSEFKKVQAFAQAQALKNITCLPYQPMEKLSGSLSAADLHLVVMGEPFVGIVHPCKIYNILTLGIPFLFIGPDQSHGADLARRLNDPTHGRTARNGDVPAIVQQIRDAMARGPQPVNAAAKALGAEFSHAVLCPQLVQVIEQAAGRA
jgi:colanic acid biosynthesis glycosyl transferase WcaI